VSLTGAYCRWCNVPAAPAPAFGTCARGRQGWEQAGSPGERQATWTSIEQGPRGGAGGSRFGSVEVARDVERAACRGELGVYGLP
jgi:hypothetical protein